MTQAATDNLSGQGNDGSSAASQNQQGQGEFIDLHIPAKDWPKGINRGDYVNAFSAATKYQGLKERGYDRLAETFPDVSGQELSDFVINALNTPPAERTDKQQKAVDNATGGAAGDDPDDRPMTRKELKALLEQERQQLRQQVRGETLQEVENRQSHREAVTQQDAAVDKALKGLGLKSSVQKVNWRGQDQEFDFVATNARRAILARAYELHMADLSPRDRQDPAKANAPFSAALIAEAAEQISPFLKQHFGAADAAGGGAADSNPNPKRNIPSVGMNGGQGGRAQKSPQDMSHDERLAAAKANVRRRLGG